MFKIIYLELTNVCNFKCEFCPTDRQTRSRGYMDVGLAKRLIQEIRDQNISRWIAFHLMGEPYLHKHLVELCQFAEDRGIHVRLLTNGSFLSPEINRQIFATGLSKLEISFRTPNSSSFATRQKGQTFEDYINKIKNLLEDHLTQKPRTEIEIKFFMRSQASFFPFVGDRRQLTDRDDTRSIMRSIHQHGLAFGKRLGTDMESFQKVKLQPSQQREEIAPGIFIRCSRIQDFWVRENTGKGDSWVKARFGSCHAFRDEFGILFNGDVTTCCVDFDGRNVVGNVRDKSLVEVLASSEVKRVRGRLDRYRPPLEFCRDCLGGPNLAYSLTKQMMTSAIEFIARRRKSTPPAG